MPIQQDTSQVVADITAVWQPIPGTSQEIALDTRCHHTLYTGARGPGKTDTQLMRFRRRVGIGYGKFWRGIIFDREYKNLDDLIMKSKRWFNEFDDGAKFLESAASLKWIWPTGEELLFRVAEKPDDYWAYHGHEYPYIGWNELTKYTSPELYDMMLSTNRSSFRPEDHPITIDGEVWKNERQISMVSPKHKNAIQFRLPPIPLEVFSTCNPYGVGHGWVKKRFIDPAPYGKTVRRKITVLDPRTKKDVVVEKTQVALFGSYSENIYLDAQYIATLESEKDANRRKAWLKGDWNIVAGGAFDDVWNEAYHVVPRFIVPHSWTIDRTFDWGSSHPFSVGWWAEADGTEATIIFDGKEYTFCPAKGSLIRIFEWYGAEVDANGEPDIGSNKGLKMSAGDIAQGIVDRESSLMANGWISTKPWPGPADNQIRDVRERDVESIELKMSKKGVRWLESDKSPGSRKNGMDLIRERFSDTVKGEGPGLYFMENCRVAIAILPILPRDPDKLDDVKYPEDHVYDETRYRVLKGAKKAATSVAVKMPS